jgi:hypothetical protein
MRLRAAGFVLALAAITFKAFLPPGFMFAEQGGRVGVVLCSIDGATATYDVVRGEFGDEHQTPASGAAGQHCPFAVAGAAAFAPSLIEIAAPGDAPVLVARATPLAERPHAPPAGPPLPARGPPLQA